MSLTFAHIVNPVLAVPESDLFVAQPITFESMRRARDYCRGELEVELITAVLEEDIPAAPSDFSQTPQLGRSVVDIRDFNIQRKLPLLRDILQNLYDVSTADYFIYTNVDIGLQRDFYTAVNQLIVNGVDSLVINRRTLPAIYDDVDDLEAIYLDPGLPHRGWDCFVFPRSYYPRFRLHNVCLGASRVGLALLANLYVFSNRFVEFQHKHLTFHVGDARNWLRREFADYDAHNTAELLRILAELERERGPFPAESIPGSFLRRRNTFGPLYDAWSRHVYLPPGISQTLNRVIGRK